MFEVPIIHFHGWVGVNNFIRIESFPYRQLHTFKVFRIELVIVRKLHADPNVEENGMVTFH